MKKTVIYFFAIFTVFIFFGCQVPITAEDSHSSSTKKDVTTENTLYNGYFITGEQIKFVFDNKIYNESDIKSVQISGTFNGWDPAHTDWQMTYNSVEDLWEFETLLEKTPVGSIYKFVINNVNWIQPYSEKLHNMYLSDDGFGGYNTIITKPVL
ncbi:MAG: hypothetical protein A2015_15355 [Spirochaetes bacterium GWF1_31_7]|nr:MAG: hypothetical protein A2Y30_11775 [Spirochaetes bacterium GWE1_32_154]OHD51197.1 MAG: hypothetical protein A2Y29_01315 [Spirochaetes bacterium GWE2_31_10]OHD52115.1 MAG: hypothetical protein A2015_15355 [Spirochaetes bacterium GWF1_31_7]HBD93291.1 hypothetical protein [Spirochaetia bacterium]